MMKTKSMFATIALAASLIAQSAPSFAADQITFARNTSKFGVQVGLCSPRAGWNWLDWIPCVTI